MFHALNKVKKINYVFNYRVFIVRNETKHVKLKKFVGFRREQKKHDLEEMRVKMLQLHDIQPSGEVTKIKNISNNDEELVSYEASPFILDEREDEKVEDGYDNKDFIKRLEKQNEKPKNVKQTLFGFVRKDDDADRVITDDMVLDEKKQEDKLYNAISSEGKNQKKELNLNETYKNDETHHNTPESTQTISTSGDNAFDEEYFNLALVHNQSNIDPKNDISKKKLLSKDEEPINPPRNLLQDTDANLFDSQYFNTANNFNDVSKDESLKSKRVDDEGESRLNDRRKTKMGLENKLSYHEEYEEEEEYENKYEKREKFGSKTKIETKNKDKVLSKKDEKMKTNEKSEEPTNAYDAVIQMRRKKKKILEGILNKQPAAMEDMIEQDVITLLTHSIIFENDDILAINKPYGLPSHGGPGVSKSVSSLINEVYKRKNKKRKSPSSSSTSSSSSSPSSSSSSSSPDFHVVHRLDKETTGVMLLAKNKRIAEILRSKFKKRKVTKVYWAVCKGVPEADEGVIDIGIKEAKIGDKYRMNLDYKLNKEESKNSRSNADDIHTNVVTNYKVLDHFDNASLVECRPESGHKHQIRCHLSQALNTPILGDHKYSHFSKIAPQRLSPDMLQKLNLRQPQVRNLNMLLHAKSLVIPEFLANGKNLHLSCPPPKTFRSVLKALQLSMPKK